MDKTDTQRNQVSVDRPDDGDLELALHAAHGLFKMLNWIDCEQVAVDKVELRNVRHDLVVAGQLMAKDILNRL